MNDLVMLCHRLYMISDYRSKKKKYVGERETLHQREREDFLFATFKIDCIN